MPVHGIGETATTRVEDVWHGGCNLKPGWYRGRNPDRRHWPGKYQSRFLGMAKVEVGWRAGRCLSLAKCIRLVLDQLIDRKP